MNPGQSSGSGSQRPRRSIRPRDHYTTTIFPIPEVEGAKQTVKMCIRNESIRQVQDNRIDDFLDSLSLLIDHGPIHSVNAGNMEYIHRTLPELYERYMGAHVRKFVARHRAETTQNEFYIESNQSTVVISMVQHALDELRGSVDGVFASMIQDETSLAGLTDETEKARIREASELKQGVLSRFNSLQAHSTLLPNMVSLSQFRTDYLAEKFAKLADQERRVQMAIEEQDEIDRLWRSCVAEHPIQDL